MISWYFTCQVNKFNIVWEQILGIHPFKRSVEARGGQNVRKDSIFNMKQKKKKTDE